MKIKWIRYQADIDCSELASGCLKNPYNDRSDTGFIISDFSSEFLKGQHVTRRLINENYEAPFGERVEREIISFDIVKFSVSASLPSVMKLNSPPRKLSSFYSDLRSVSGPRSIIQDIKLDPMSLISGLESLGHKCTLLSAELGDINVDNTARASISLSGTKDIRSAIDHLTSNRKYSVKRARCEVLSKSDRFLFSITSGGGFRLEKGEESVLDEVEKILF